MDETLLFVDMWMMDGTQRHVKWNKPCTETNVWSCTHGEAKNTDH